MCSRLTPSVSGIGSRSTVTLTWIKQLLKNLMVWPLNTLGLGRLCAEPERRLLSNAFRPPGEVKWTLD
ncbi:hypothetical protein PDJAM_G00110340 [Pangasius djambal]|uniref:Uncharacterized protein n=1 Tax=Pangasius djambal TaxID=1691987 RepID=A0ACC5Y427_9TELE|nr:hypothetical protein [Pangasius djambal]